MRDSPEVTIRALTRVAVAFTLMQQLGAVAAIGQTPAATTPARGCPAGGRRGNRGGTKRGGAGPRGGPPPPATAR